MWLDNASSIDMLFYSPYADTVAKFAKNSSLTPLTIGLYGSWGAGKSSLLNMINDRLSEAGDEEKVVCISLNAWQFEGYEDAKTAIMEALLKSLKENKTFKEKAGEKIKSLIQRIDYLKLGKNLAKKGLPFALSALTGNPLPVALSLTADLSTNATDIVSSISTFKEQYIKAPEDDSKIENIRKFRDEFEKMLEEVESIKNLTVIIDDLDRCTPDRIIDTLEAIKLFLSVKKTTFIIAVDQRIIEYAVKTKYQAIDGYELSSDYIEKIIQLPIKIPELSPKDIENYLLLLICQLHIREDEFKKIIDYIYSEKLLLNEKAIDFGQIEAFITNGSFTDYCDDETEFKSNAHTIEKIRSVVSPSLKGNPRQTKRFLNTFFVRKNLAELYFSDELDVSIIAKLLSLEIIDIDLFRKLNDWNKTFDGENSQLKKLETYTQNQDGEIEDELRKWVTKGRILNWLQSEPNDLYKIDLSKYFYLSRESLANEENIDSTFSEEEKQLLYRIINCVAGQEDSRIAELESRSPSSKAKIMEVLLKKFKSEDIGLSHAAALFVRYPEYQNDICEIITKGNINIKLGIASIPHLKRMFKANNQLISDMIDSLIKDQRLKDTEKKVIVEDDDAVVTIVERSRTNGNF
ncbi:MAG: hypothetical protein IJH07_08140 [Ruminococcus sp.]|nr:hypothetical protein [Ruminococcus sp.]